MNHHLSIDAAELATVLAALRYYQSQGLGDPDNRPEDIHELATDAGEVDSSLDDEGIDALCQKINLAPTYSKDAQAMRRLLAAFDAQFGGDADGDEEINGGDAVQWICDFVPLVRSALADTPEGDLEQAVLVTGNPVAGFTIIGPFQDHETATEYGDNVEDGDWWVLDLQAPETDL